MQKLLYFDVEYANSQNKSICQLGLISEFFPSGEPIFPEKNIYVNPEDGFQDWCIRVHGITEKQVENEKNFPKIWNEIKVYFTDSIIVGHNVYTSDLIALSKTCTRYNIELPTIKFIDTMKIARKYIPFCEVKDYGVHSLCKYFDIDTDKSHDAFDDACATSDLFKCLVETFNININDYIEIFEPNKVNSFIRYIADPALKSTMSEFYGVIEGFSLDEKIKPDEEAYLKKWQKDNQKYSEKEELSNVFATLNKILEDGVITIDELRELKIVVKDYYDTIISSHITKSIQELRGILKGIITDNIVSTEEGEKLLHWLYNNIQLNEHYPYNFVLDLFNNVLEDNKITEEESKSLIQIINSVLKPVEALSEKINSITDKNICLSGNFEYGKKADVQKLITDNGGFIETNIRKTTDILVIGKFESQAYAHGNYGTKVRKAMELNCKGCNISILKEEEFIKNLK